LSAWYLLSERTPWSERNSRGVEHALEEALHAAAADQGEQAAVAEAGLVPARDQGGEVGAIVEVPLEALGEAREGAQEVGFDGLDGEQGDEADQRAELEALGAAVGEVEDVVEEFVVGVPQADALAAEVVHGVGDGEEVLEELAGDVLVDLVGRGRARGRSASC
jgi:hypothetical protein